MKKALKTLGIILVGFILFLSYFIWFNIKDRDNQEALLQSLPKKVIPKYSMDSTSNWWEETTVYQIYPRSFKDSDGDGIGDIQGIIDQLDYMKTMGFETLWISPFFTSPQADHGYDVSNYREIQPEYGDMPLVDSLISEIHKRDMKVVFDLVLNHTSIAHDWFQESRASKNNKKSDWYVWRNGKNGNPPNNWKNILGRASAWNYVPERDQYYYAAFLPFQPDLNMSNPEVREAIFDMVRFWLDRDVDGFRLDIFNFIFEDQSFKDNPFTWQLLPNFGEGKWSFENHKYNFHQPEVIKFAKDLRAILESNPDGRFMVGEVFGSHRHMRELLGEEKLDGLNLVFLFDFLESFEFSTEYFREKAIEYESFYPYPMVPTYVFGNHDQFRSITRLENNRLKAELLAAFQLTMRGVPFIYMGEEIGMTTGDISLENAEDPIAQYWTGIPRWLRDDMPIMINRDNCRTPIQWTSETSAGFSSNSNTWLPVQDNYRDINIQNQLSDNSSLLYVYKDILKLRNQSSALRQGHTEFIESNTSLPKDVLSYTRSNKDQQLTIYLNFSETAQSISLKDQTASVSYQKRASMSNQNILLEGYGILILETNR